MTIENTYIVDRNLKTVVDQLEEIKELLGGSSSGGSMIINITQDEDSGKLTFNKTAGECFEAYSNGIICIGCQEDGNNKMYEVIYSAVYSNETYSFITLEKIYKADSENEYPSELVD